MVIEESVQRQAEKLHHDRARKQRGAGSENVRVEVDETGFKNVAGDDDADAQVGKAFLAVLVDDALFLQQRAGQHHRKQRELQAAKL